jgi:DNA-binding MarR family transcriptional regulator
MSRLNTEDFQDLAEFRHLLRKFLRFSKDFLRKSAGLNPEQYEALLAIKAFEGKHAAIISELSERLQVKHHSAVNIVDRLVEKKLVTRSAGEADRRRRHLSLTAKGSQLIENLASVHRKEIRGRSGDMIQALEKLKK